MIRKFLNKLFTPTPWPVRRSSVPTPKEWVQGGVRGQTGEAMEREKSRLTKAGAPGFEDHPDFQTNTKKDIAT